MTRIQQSSPAVREVGRLMGQEGFREGSPSFVGFRNLAKGEPIDPPFDLDSLGRYKGRRAVSTAA